MGAYCSSSSSSILCFALSTSSYCPLFTDQRKNSHALMPKTMDIKIRKTKVHIIFTSFLVGQVKAKGAGRY